MNIWRSVTLVLWSVVLGCCGGVILYNLAAQNTILNVAKSKERLASSKTYEALRDTVIANHMYNSVQQRYPSNNLVSKALIQETLRDTVSTSELSRRLSPVIDSTYLWLDSKATSVEFSVSFADNREVFYKALEARVDKKVSALPQCTSYAYPPEDALLKDNCLPAYVSAKEATQALMGSVRASDFPLQTVTQDTVASSVPQLASLKQLPQYVSYVWALNLFSIAVGVFIAGYLLWTRRLLGVVAVGLGMALAGVAAFAVHALVLQRTASQLSGEYAQLALALRDALLPPLSTTVYSYAAISVLLGLIVAGIPSLWLWRKHHNKARVTS